MPIDPALLDTVRYWAAVLLIMLVPPAIVYWLILHPFAGYWRKRGPVITLTVGFGQLALFAGLLFLLRDRLVGADLGFSWWLTAAAIVLYIGSIITELAIRGHLTVAILVGLPEFSEERESELLQKGIYARLRHPRYVNVMMATTAWAMFANYVGTWVLLPITAVLLRVLVHFEERELIDRFGEEYRDYSRRVPRFWPRFRSP